MIEDESILTAEEKEYIKDKVLSDSTTYCWIKESVRGEGKPCFIHPLIHRGNQQIVSEYANFFQIIAQGFATGYKIPCNVFLRVCINLTYPQSGRSAPHVDHPYPHYQFLLHLNKSDGWIDTYFRFKGKSNKNNQP